MPFGAALLVAVMEIETIIVTPFQQNCRVLFDPLRRVGMVVDPGGDIPRISSVIERLGVQIETILLTHAHIDHAGGVEPLREYLVKRGDIRPRLLAHSAEERMRKTISDQAIMFGLSARDYSNVEEPDHYVDDGDRIELGGYSGTVLFTPGHSPGHVVLFFPGILRGPVLVGGDTLFAGSIGRTDLPGGNHGLLLESLREKILTLPGETRVLPGHGPDTTVGVEARTNPFLINLR